MDAKKFDSVVHSVPRFEQFGVKKIKDESVYVTSIKSPVDFHVILSSGEKEREQFEEEVKRHCVNCYFPPECIEVGQQCFVFSQMFKKWCRAEIEDYYFDDSNGEVCFDNLSTKRVKAFLVDYGHLEEVPIINIREKQDELFDVSNYPVLRIHCSLHNLKPPDSDEWSPNATDIFIKFVRNQRVTMYVKEVMDGVHYVDLSHGDNVYGSGSSSLIQYLVFTGVAKFKLGEMNRNVFR